MIAVGGAPPPPPLADTPARYGPVSRALHWAMAVLIAWQLLVGAGWKLLDPGAMRAIAAVGPSHGGKGVLILLLVLPRLVWALANRRARPPAAPGWPGRAATAGHATLYLLMLAIPVLALAGAYASGKGFAWLGMPLVPATGREDAALFATIDEVHATLGWALAVLVAGHIAMALLHTRDGVLRRMLRI